MNCIQKNVSRLGILVLCSASLLFFSCKPVVGVKESLRSAGPIECVADSPFGIEVQEFMQPFPFVNKELQNVTATEELTSANSNQLVTSSKSKISLRIIGGDVSSTTTGCQSPTLGTSAKNVVQTNTVGIAINNINPTALETCTGEVIGPNLILTAAHCFDHADISLKSPGVVAFTDNVGVDDGATWAGLNSTNSQPIACWQRHPKYNKNGTYAERTLYDIAWIKVNKVLNSFKPVSLLSNPTQFSPTEEKLLAGFGTLNNANESPGAPPDLPNGNGSTTPKVKHCVSTKSYSGTGYPLVGDMLAQGSRELFNSQTFPNAYGNLVAVIGPIIDQTYTQGKSPAVTPVSPDGTNTNTGPTSSKGVCAGDSGGPAYVYRNGSWVIGGIVHGTDNVLTSKPLIYDTGDSSVPENFDLGVTPAQCVYGYAIFTLVGPYLPWIESSSGVSVSKI